MISPIPSLEFINVVTFDSKIFLRISGSATDVAIVYLNGFKKLLVNDLSTFIFC